MIITHDFNFPIFKSLLIWRERDRDRERSQARVGGCQREREKDNLKQAPHCQSRASSQNQALDT